MRSTMFLGWSVSVLVAAPNKDDAFKIHLLNERTLEGTFFVNYKPKTDIPRVEIFMLPLRNETFLCWFLIKLYHALTPDHFSDRSRSLTSSSLGDCSLLGISTKLY